MLYLVVVVMCTLYIQYSSCSKTDLVSAIDQQLSRLLVVLASFVYMCLL